MIKTLREWTEKLKITAERQGRAEVYRASGEFKEIYDKNGMALPHRDFYRKQNNLFAESGGALIEVVNENVKVNSSK